MFLKFIQYYKPQKKIMSFVLTMVAFYTLIELSIPVFTRIILNDLIPAHDTDGVLRLALLMLGLIFIFAFLHYLVGYYGHIFGIAIEKDMRMRAFAKIERLPFKYFDVNKTGVIMSRLTDDLHMVSELAHHGIEEVTAVTLMLGAGYFYLASMNFWVSTFMFMVFLCLIFLVLFSRRGQINAFRRLRREQGEINSRLEGSISGIRLTRAFSNEDYEIEKFDQDNDRYIEAYRGAYKALGVSNALNNFFVQFMSVAVLVVGSFLVLNQEFSTGDMFAYFLYFNLLVSPIKRMMTLLETFQQGWAGFERYLQLLEEPVEIEDMEGAYELSDIVGDIVFENVSFAYGKDKKTVLKDFSLAIPQGKMLALVGPSGVGKTTITQLILRFYEIQKGRILLDDHNIREITLKSLRENIGYIQQDVIIFWGTIAENIAYGKPQASMEEIIEAAKKAGIHDFVMSLNKNYDTLVGERGVMLSGGQKQRISIARIFLKDPKILILDEATSALDNITESYIQQSFEELAYGRTVIVVAHRLTTVQKADKIIVMGKTGIMQSGKHEDLLRQKGHYRDLYEASRNNILPSDIEF